MSYLPQAIGTELGYKSISLSSADILGLTATPIEFLPAPGAGKVYRLLSCIIDYTFGTIAYTNAGLKVYFLGGTSPVQDFILNSGSSAIRDAGIATQTNALANTAMWIGAAAGTPASGDGTAKVHAYYQIVTL